MSEPVVFDVQPIGVDIQPGEKKYWCQCGRSRSQPYCDGSHRGTGFAPLEFTVEKGGRHYLCQCKHTKTPPFCDGSHKGLQKG